MIPTKDSNHQAEALALLTEMFKKQPNIQGFLKSFVPSVQQIEDAIFVYLSGILLDNAVGDVLDKYGAIIKEPRNSLADSEYKILIRATIRANKSKGLSEDIIAVANLIISSFSYEEFPPAGFYVYAPDLISYASTIIHVIGIARGAGVKGNFLFHDWASPNNIMFQDSVSGGIANARGFMDSISGQSNNAMISSQEFIK